MTDGKNKMLKHTQYLLSIRAPYLFYTNLESLLKKLPICKINLEKSSMPKLGENIEFSYSITTICAFSDKTIKRNKYKGKDSMQTI